jgi:arylsulfatase A-like enzyme
MAENTINRREFLKYAGVGLATLAIPGSVLAAVEDGRRPNILVIVSDDHGYGEVGVYGGKEIPTPNMDSLAKNGVRFTNGYVSCPVCSPTRAGLITGRYQQRFGHEFNPGPPTAAETNFGLPLTETTLASRLKSAGYATGMVGKWHLGYREGYRPVERGFDEFFGFLGGAHQYVPGAGDPGNPIMRGNETVEEKEYLTDAFAREAVSFIDKHKQHPFFLYLTFNAVHSPLQSPDKYLGRFSSIKDQKRRTFAAMLSAMDDAIGEVLESLRKNKLEEDTLIFFVSDNGGPTPQTTSGNGALRSTKGQVYEGGIRVPFMAQWKGRLPAGKVYDEPVIALDIAPTACAVAGAKTEGAKFDGVDVLPFLTGKAKGAPHKTLYWRFGEQSAVRDGDWKLVKISGSESELFDLSKDIGEKTNLASTKPEKVKELDDKLAKWDSQLVAPLWRRGRPVRQQQAGRQRRRAS